MTKPTEDIPEWALRSTELMNLVKRQGLTLDEAYEIVERLAISESDPDV